MYVSVKRVTHEIDKIKARRSKEDLIKLELMEALEIISYDEYKTLRRLVNSKRSNT